MNGAKVKSIRLFLGESQAAFARRLGVAASTVCAIENDQRQITDYVRSKLVLLEADLPDSFTDFFILFNKNT